MVAAVKTVTCEDCYNMRSKIPLPGGLVVKEGVIVKDAKLDFAKAKAVCQKGMFQNAKGKDLVFTKPYGSPEWKRAEDCKFFQEA
jgi:hypothetical protein